MFFGLAHQVENADRARARVVDAGFEASAIRDGHKPGTRVFTTKEAPLGIPTLFIEPVKQP